MARFTISATGPTSAAPVERHAETASQAEHELHILQRLVGKYGKIVIYRETGPPITKERLASLALAERKARGVAT